MKTSIPPIILLYAQAEAGQFVRRGQQEKETIHQLAEWKRIFLLVGRAKRDDESAFNPSNFEKHLHCPKCVGSEKGTQD